MSASGRRPSARSVAVDVVRRVTDEGAFSNLVLPAALARSGLDARDRDLVSELAYGTLRRLIPIDHALAPLVARPLADASPAARAALRLGAYQALYTRIADHAAVAATVDLVGKPERGFVNAVLRRLLRDGVSPPEGDDDAAISVRTGLAQWAVAELRRLVPADELEPAAVAIASPAPLTLRVNPCRASAGDLAGAIARTGRVAEPGRVHAGSLRLAGGRPTELPGYGEGWFAVQDEASSYVVDVLDPRPGERVLDAAAGPGGKAGDIACRAAEVVAADATIGRARLVAGTAARLGVTVRLLVQDAARPALREGFDRVLLDAPCSGVGAARRRPELLWRPHRTELAGLARLQVRLALGAASLLRPGGTLVYSVCTFPRAETDAARSALLGKAPWLRPAPFPGPDGSEDDHVRLWPHRHGTDAMYVARFVRDGGSR